jgi:hypothetical protein
MTIPDALVPAPSEAWFLKPLNPIAFWLVQIIVAEISPTRPIHSDCGVEVLEFDTCVGC